MIYLLSTNRPEWAEYAYRQYRKFGRDCVLVVLDNSEQGISFYKKKADFYYHIPDCENVSQMYNWFLDNFPESYDIFYSDDDAEYHPKCKTIMEKYLKLGWDMVINCRMYASDDKGSSYFMRKPHGVGSGWLISKEVAKLARFKSDTIEGVCIYIRDLRTLGVNIKTIYTPLVNLKIHDTNAVLRREHYKFEMPLVDWGSK